jgi:ipoprotein LpqH
MVNRAITVVIAGAATVATVLAGCSSNKSSTGASTSATPAATGTQVIVDGQNQNVTGAVTCTPNGDNIGIGIGDVANGVGAVLSTATPPIVHSVGLGNVGGVTLGYSDAAPGQSGNAGAAVDGKTYAIKGNATGLDPNTSQTVTKPFEIDVTCP